MCAWTMDDNGRVAKAVDKAREAARAFALALPGAWEDHPWSDTVIKVGKKIFLFLGRDDPAAFGLSVKLPQSAPAALMLPYASPTGYGLGKAGWVSASMDARSIPPPEMIEEWIEESYRAIAPKKLIAQLEGGAGVVGSREPEWLN